LGNFSSPWYERSAYTWDPVEIPEPCDPASPFSKIEVYDFWDTCAHKWVEHPSDSLWNTQTEDSACYCSSDAGAPYFVNDTDGELVGEESRVPDAQYFWWYGTCHHCINGANDLTEADNGYLPSDHFDDDLDGVPDNCDLCPDFDDSLDDDGDRVPDSCDKCPGFDDYIDINSNGIPDDCDLCALNGCGDDATCKDIPVNKFECTCDLGFRINAPVYSPAALATALFGGIPNWITWLTTHPDVVSTNIEDTDAKVFTDEVEAGAFSFNFVLKHDLKDYQITNFFEEFVAEIEDMLESCKDCGSYYLNFSWEHVAADVNGDLVTHLAITIEPFQTWAVFDATVDGSCVRINECNLYGCDDNSDCFLSVANERYCICHVGFSGDRHLIGAAKFPGCTAPVDTIDECAAYGCHPSTAGLEPGLCEPGSTPTERKCVCDVGFEGDATLEDDEPFLGCSPINHCVGDPCGEHSTCTNMLLSYQCECDHGFLDTSGDSSNCQDPCDLNNGGCQDECVSPTEDSRQSCACANQFAEPSLLDPRKCVCKEGFFGDGTQCTSSSACLAYTVFGPPFLEAPEEVNSTIRDDTPSSVCQQYFDRTSACCSLSSDLFDPNVLEGDLEASGECIDLLSAFYCSTCSPDQTFLQFTGTTFVIRICPDYCQQIFETCADAKVTGDRNSIIGSYTDPISFCEESLVNYIPYLDTKALGISVYVDAHTRDRSLCFSFANGVSPMVTLTLFVFALWTSVGF